MAETDAQGIPLMYAVTGLRDYFRQRPDVYVSGNLLIYYEEGNKDASVAPDVFVVIGVPKPSASDLGRGEQTLVDSSVRACWQIGCGARRGDQRRAVIDRPGDRQGRVFVPCGATVEVSRRWWTARSAPAGRSMRSITVTGGVWRDTLTDISARAATGLGCPPEHTEAHLYKLLVYEPGGFFAAHRDTEKVDGMIATMVLSLPVAGAGGELVIRHKERETVVDMRTAEPSELAFAAFYADCIHETLPVSAGHRIAMVYHLVLRKGAASGALQTAPDFSAQEERIAAQLRTWETSATAGNKLV